jgi:hypothetical protein
MSIGNINTQLELSPVGIGLQKVAQIVKVADFTDGGAAVGTKTLSKQIPAGAFVLGSKVTVKTGFTGDTTCVLDVGTSADPDLFSFTTHSIFAAAENLVEACDGTSGGTETGLVPVGTAVDVLLTATGGSDWGLVTAGVMLVEIFYLSTNTELSNGYPRRVDL